MKYHMNEAGRLAEDVVWRRLAGSVLFCQVRQKWLLGRPEPHRTDRNGRSRITLNYVIS